MKFTICNSRNVKVPNYGTAGSAGIDFYVPENFTYDDLKWSPSESGSFPDTVSRTSENDGIVTAIHLYPGRGVVIPSGIKVKIPNGYVLVFLNKSGVSLRKSVVQGAQVIDSDYTGEIHLHLINTGNAKTTISAGEKISQALLLPVEHCELVQVKSEKELFADFETERKDGGFGSTGV